MGGGGLNADSKKEREVELPFDTGRQAYDQWVQAARKRRPGNCPKKEF